MSILFPKNDLLTSSDITSSATISCIIDSYKVELDKLETQFDKERHDLATATGVKQSNLIISIGYLDDKITNLRSKIKNLL